MFHHLRKFPGLEIQKIGAVEGALENWANNWEGDDKFLMKGAVRRKVEEINFGSLINLPGILRPVAPDQKNNFGKVQSDYLKP